jgi:hypothetical protein
VLLPGAIKFGKHRGTKWTDIPPDYLKWICRQEDMDADVRFTARHHLQALTPHAYPPAWMAAALALISPARAANIGYVGEPDASRLTVRVALIADDDSVAPIVSKNFRRSASLARSQALSNAR